jgi:hypothetical protein
MLHRRLLPVSVAFCLLVLPSFISGKRDDLTDYKIKKLGESATLWCNESVQISDAPPNDTFIPVSWMLPNLTVLSASSGKFNVSEDKWSLHVNDVTRAEIGQYHCMLRRMLNETYFTGWYLARLGLNAQGPYFEDLWDKYETNTIIGISAGFGFLALAIGAMLVWHFRYESPPDDEDDKQTNGTPPYMAYDEDSKTEKPVATTYSNEAYDGNYESSEGTEKAQFPAASDATSEPSSDSQSTRDKSGPADDSGTAF